MCKAGGRNGSHENYDRPHVPVEGLYDNQPIFTCRFCGVRLDEGVRGNDQYCEPPHISVVTETRELRFEEKI